MKSLLRFFPLNRIAIAGAVVLTAFLVPMTAPAQLVTARFITSFDTWERFDTIGVSHKIFRGFQSAIVDIGQGRFSLHTNMQAATTDVDLPVAGSDYRLYNLYLKATDLGGIADVSLGRVPYYFGVGMGTLDGGVVAVRTRDRLYRLSLYGGASAPMDFGIHSLGTMKDKFAIGGQFLFNPLSDLRGSLSYMNRRQPLPPYYAIRVNPETLDGSTVLIVPEPEREQMGGVDLTYTTRSGITAYGRYDYNFEETKTQYGQLGLRYVLNPDVLISFYATRREPRVPAGSFFSQFTLKGTTEIEGGADYFFLPRLRAFLRGAYVAYDGANSFRYTAGIGREDVQLVVRGNTGYAGELASVSLQGAYPLLDNHIVPNAGLSYMSYKVDENAPRYSATAAVLGATVRPVSSLSFDLQGQWLNNYIVKSDFRFVGRIHFWFSDRLNLFD